MYTLKSLARRSTAFGAALALVASVVMPAAAAYAQSALNPLTERSLLLSSSAPGYIDTDGSGYSTGSPNPAAIGNPGTPGTFAPAGSGPNGKKTGQTFSFRVSSTDTVHGMSFQYCTTAAGNCQAPGDNWKVNGATTNEDNLANGDGDFRNGTDHTADGRADNSVAHPLGFSDFDITDGANGFTQAQEGAEAAEGEFQILHGGTPVSEEDWSFSVTNLEDDDHSGTLTGQNNYITLTSATGLELEAGDYVQVVFKASEDTYITNPGSGHFFVKINTYNSDTNLFGFHNEDGVNNAGEEDHTVIDGGVTVANVMTDSIHITTKVLETMAFSVGTRNRETVVGPHGTCDAIDQVNNNRLRLGDPDAEFSLDTSRAYDVHSYWRLSSNSSGGAAVYYSGNTLANTVGDEIAPMETKDVSIPGTEQFGLGFVDPSVLTIGHDGVMEAWDPAFYNPAYDPGDPEAEPPVPPTGTPGLVQSQPERYKLPSSFPFITHDGQSIGVGEFAELTAAQTASADYMDANGTITGPGGSAGEAQFKFLKSSLTEPALIAQQNETVISCATAKMRYVANIGADTPAGVYTTKINYLAAPQY